MFFAPVSHRWRGTPSSLVNHGGWKTHSLPPEISSVAAASKQAVSPCRSFKGGTWQVWTVQRGMLSEQIEKLVSGFKVRVQDLQAWFASQQAPMRVGIRKNNPEFGKTVSSVTDTFIWTRVQE